MKAGQIILVGCGARKRDEPAQAGNMYTGPYFDACYSTALELGGRGAVFILSAFYGLLRPWTQIHPYELRLGQPGSIGTMALRAQAEYYGVLHLPVLALCGADYADLAAAVWADVERPLKGLGIGQQRHQLAVMRAAAGQSGRMPAGALGRPAG